MKAMLRVDGRWEKEYPTDLNKWLWQHDGAEAVCIDGSSYYCSTHALIETYRQTWEKERKKDDRREAKTFYDLSYKLWLEDKGPNPQDSAAWCQSTGVLCSEIGECCGGCHK